MERPGWFDVVRFPAGVTMISEPGHEEDVKSYLVDGERDVAVLDTGMGVGDFAALVASLSDRAPIVLHSHAHFDHIGSSASFDRVFVHASEAGDLRAGFPNERFRTWFQSEHLIGERLPEDFDPTTAEIAGCDPAGTIEHGQSFDLGERILEAFHTPGHSPGGMTLLDRENRILFPGDAVYAGPMFAWRPYSDPVAYRKSLRRLAELADLVDVVYPSHNRVPLLPGDIRAMHEAFEEVWGGRSPDRSDAVKDIFEFGDFSFWLRRGAYGDSR